MDRFSQDIYDAKSSAGAGSIGVEYDKYKNIYRRNTVPDSRVLVFLTGFCLGMVFFYLSGIKLMDSGRFPAALLAENIYKLRDFDFYAARLFEYAALRRMGQLIFMLICAAGFMRLMFLYAFLGCGGFELGIVMFSLTYQYGLKGLLLSVLLLFPHGIFFFISFILLFDKNMPDYKKDYHKYNQIMENGLHNKVTKVKRTVVILSFWFVGILSEVYINPEIIKKMAIFFK